MKKIFKSTVFIAILINVMLPTSRGMDDGAGKVKVIIISPGMPEVEKEAQKFVDQFSGLIAQEAGLDPAAINAFYFADTAAALGYLGENRDAFIIASLGFFLSQRQALGLVPLAAVELSAGPSEHYYLMVKKGKFGSLTDLKGKTLSGNTLYEDAAFLSKIVFDGKVDAAAHFKLEPTSRPLSALRQVAGGELDAALLDQPQYESLKSLPFAAELEAIYISPKLPDVGVMMIDTAVTRKLEERFMKALRAMSGDEAGGKALKGFGVKEFKPVSPDSFCGVIEKFEGVK